MQSTLGPRTALLIEENPIYFLTIRDLLATVDDGRWRLEWADCLTTGLGHLTDASFDLILVDLSFPEARAAGVLRDVRSRAPAAPVIALVGRGDEALGLQAVQEGAADYLIRQEVDVNVLLQIFRRAVERKHLEAYPHVTGDHFHVLVENAVDIVMVLDDTGTIRYVNPLVQKVLGYAPRDVRGQVAFAFVHPDDLPDVTETFMRMVENLGPVRPVEFRCRHRDGSWRILEGRWVDLLNDPMVGGISITLRDVTERRRVEEQSRRDQRMEAIGRVSGGLAHDFKNLVTAINGFGELLLTRLDAADPRREFVREIIRAGSATARLTDQLLAFTRQQIVRPTAFDLNDTVTSLQEILHFLIREDIRLVTSLAPDPGWLNADPGQIEQIIMNLVTNARDAMPQGGQITITTAYAELDAAFAERHPGVQPGSYVVLVVHDTGIGMDQETREHIFEPFFTTKALGHGTGLGMPTVWGIVTQNQGAIDIDSVVGQGTTVTVYLPRVDAPAARPVSRVGSAKLPSGSGTILVVEDDEAVRAFVSQTLTTLGYTVLSAAQGNDALAVAAEHAGQIDLLIADVVMPGFSGSQVVKQLTPRNPEMAVIYTSGYPDNVVRQHGVESTHVAYLPKPFTPSDLARTVHRVLQERDHPRETHCRGRSE